MINIVLIEIIFQIIKTRLNRSDYIDLDGLDGGLLKNKYLDFSFKSGFKETACFEVLGVGICGTHTHKKNLATPTFGVSVEHIFKQ